MVELKSKQRPRLRSSPKDATVVHDTKYYRVVLDKSVNDSAGEANWAIVNKRYDTVEVRLAVLPSAIHTCDNLNKHMQALADGGPPPLNVVPLDGGT